MCMCRIFQKVSLSTFYILVLFSPKHPIAWAFLVEKPPKSCQIDFGQQKIENLGKDTFASENDTSL